MSVNALPERMQLAVEAGAKRILIPSDKKRDVAEVPDAILTATQWQVLDRDAVTGKRWGIEPEARIRCFGRG